VGEACKCIQCPLVHLARVCCLTASAVTPRGYEKERLPLRTLTSYRMISCRLSIFLHVLEGEKTENGNERKKLGIEFH
jgi:hypothetical protein